MYPDALFYRIKFHIFQTKQMYFPKLLLALQLFWY